MSEKSLVENYEAFGDRLQTKADGYAVVVQADGSLYIEGACFSRDAVETRLMPFLRGAYGRNVLPAEVEAFQAACGPDKEWDELNRVADELAEAPPK